MTAILGISAFYHDSAAAIVVDGEIVAAAQEERFSRKKHDASFPTGAVAYCLRETGLTAEQLDYTAYYEKPLTKFERLLETFIGAAPFGFRNFRAALPVWLKDKLFLRRLFRRHIPSPAPLIFLDHHESHAASAFFPSPYDEAAILTLDGVGEWTTTAFGVGRGNRIELTDHIAFPHSLGLLYSAFTYYCGFKVNSGEYKLMGLAPYGRPVYTDVIYKHLIDLKADGSLRLNMQYFHYCRGLTMTNSRFDRLFGSPPRHPEARLDQRHMDLAASIQAVTEDVMLRVGRHVHRRTGMKNLVLAGGVALNCVANARLLREGPFDSIWIQPAAGDAGGALGAALFVWYQLLKNERSPGGRDLQKGSLLGPRFSPEEIHSFLSEKRIAFEPLPESVLLDRVAASLEQEQVVGWFQGRMEYGPRALGCRSILGDSRSRRMQSFMNQKIKFRESFRPFAPSVLAEQAAEMFDLPKGQLSSYMLLVAPVRDKHRLPMDETQLHTLATHPDLNARLDLPRSRYPAITHVDFSARLQTVDAEWNPRYHALLTRFRDRTGCPMLVNTSFNIRGEPIVCTPHDALNCFLATDMDVLVLEDVVLHKADLKHLPRTDYRSRVAPD